jgi:hypothetical protein
MLSRLRARLTYANVIATVALFVALGGSSWAALQLPKNSVGPRQLKKNSVTSVKVKPGSLLTNDFKASQRAALRGPQGSQGPQGLQGAKGDPGVQGPAGPTQGSATPGLAGAVPSATPEVTHATHAITTTTAGRLFVFGRATASVTCSVGSPKVALYVDDIPVTGSGHPFPSAAATVVSVFGASEPLDAGPHTVRLQSDCVDGTFVTAQTSASAEAGAILLGGS